MDPHVGRAHLCSFTVPHTIADTSTVYVADLIALSRANVTCAVDCADRRRL
jgi:hypothetical protein